MIPRLPRIVIVLFSAGLIALSGCRTEYGIANLNGPTTFMPKPNYADTTSIPIKATYISGSYTHNAQNVAYGDNEQVEFGSIMFNHSRVEKQYDLSYGVFSFAGDYRVSPERLNPGTKSIWGVGGMVEGNLRLGKHYKNFSFGPRLGVMYEGGEYAEFRKLSDGQETDFVNINPDPVTFHTGIQMRLNFFVNDFSFGFQSYWGSISSRIRRNAQINTTLFANYNRWTFKAELGATLLLNNRGYNLTSFGLAYEIW